MRQVVFAPTFPAWQKAARAALQEEVEPGEIHWQELLADQPALDLYAEEIEPSRGTAPTARFRVPRQFLLLARKAACYRDERRWALLYRALWRLTHGEPKLLDILSDPDVRELFDKERAVRRDMHKMRAFVRFREVQMEDGAWFVSWFEPEHRIVEENAAFFADRFASMRWSILTPDRGVHWDGRELSFTVGAVRSEAPTEDATEELWRNYYAHIFNPARVKTRALTKEMPKRYWKNLPEASVIPALLQEAPGRVQEMMAQSDRKHLDPADWHPAQPPATGSLHELSAAAGRCQACPLYREATQTVFGEGLRQAGIVLLGEQPGDREDREGRPFIGPAGQLLDRALAEAGVNREECYVTNVVKHFKWEPRGKRRLHQTPNARDIAACRPWFEAELALIKPRTLICLGATAVRAIFGPGLRVTQARGEFRESAYAPRTLITVHPSSLLRAPTEEAREEAYRHFVADLRLAAPAR